VGAIRSGTTVGVDIVRGGVAKAIDVTVGQRGGNESVARAPVVKNKLGIELAQLDSNMMKELGLDHGVQIISVAESSTAESAGLVANDIILQFNGIKVSNPEQLVGLVETVPSNKAVAVLIQRDGNPSFITLRVTETLE